MVEPVSTALLVTAGYVGQRTLGPTLSMIGREIEAAAEPRVQNLLSIVERAHARGGDATGDQSVHPRVLDHFVREGSWIEDAAHQEYVAGLLLSARQHEDDEQLEVFQTITSMTRRQIRLHHAAYWSLAQVAVDQQWGLAEVHLQHAIHGETDDVTALLECDAEAATLVVDSMSRQQTLSTAVLDNGVGGRRIWTSTAAYSNPFLAAATMLGIRVFLGAYGVRAHSVDDINVIDWSVMPPIGPTLDGFAIRPM